MHWSNLFKLIKEFIENFLKKTNLYSLHYLAKLHLINLISNFIVEVQCKKTRLSMKFLMSNFREHLEFI